MQTHIQHEIKTLQTTTGDPAENYWTAGIYFIYPGVCLIEKYANLFSRKTIRFTIKKGGYHV